MDALSIIKSSIATVKKLKSLSDKIKNAEYLNLIADLNISLADLKMKVAELLEENNNLKSELATSNKNTSFRGRLKLINGAYYFKEPIENRPIGPYCTRCFDADDKMILLTELKPPFDAFGNYECQNCKGIF